MVILSLLSTLMFVFFNTLSYWMISSLIATIMNPSDNVTNIQKNDLSIHDKLENITHQLIGNGTQLEQLKMLCILLIFNILL